MSYLFRWQGLQEKQTKQGILAAKNVRELTRQLNKRQIILLSARKLGRYKHLKIANLLPLFEQLCPLLKAGVPILESMQMIASTETTNKRNHLMKLLIDEISGGKKMSETIACYLDNKEQSTAKLLALGEHNGQLIFMLEKLIQQKQREQKMKKRLIQALIYPSFLAVVSLGVMLILTLWVVPQFEQTYANMSMKLPFSTQLTLAASNILLQYGHIIAAGLVVGIVILHIAVSIFDSLRQLIARLQMACPILGKLYQAYCLRHFASNLKISYQAGMPISESLAWLHQTTAQHVYGSALHRLYTQVSQGASLKKALQNTTFFPLRVVQFVAVGEQSGQLEESLLSIEQYYDDQLETHSARLLALFEPCLIVWIAICIAWIVVTMYLPIFNLGYAF